MSERQALLDGVLAAPDDNAPRLVFADWLDEHDETDRAEFIRVQCERASLPFTDPRRAELGVRERDLLEAHEYTWLGELPSIAGVSWGEFERGFVEGAGFDNWLAFAERADEGFAVAPVRQLRFPYGMPPREWQAFGRWPGLSRIQGLELSFQRHLTPARFQKLLASKHLTRLEVLNLVGVPRVDETLRAVMECGKAERLRELRFSMQDAVGDIPPDLLDRLAVQGLEVSSLRGGVSPHLLTDSPGSRRVQRWRTGLSEDQYRVLTASPYFRPGSLDLISGGRGIGEAVSTFLRSPAASDLTELRISLLDLDPPNVAALASSRYLASLRTLFINGNGIGDLGLRHLTKLTGLTSLCLIATGITVDGIRDLSQSETLTRLGELDLGNNALGDDAIVALARWPGLASVRELRINVNRLTDVGIRALAASPFAAGLTRLSMAGNSGITDASAIALAESPFMSRLVRLEAGSTRIGDTGITALSRLPRLSRLVLPSTEVGDAGARALADAASRDTLTAVNLQGTNVTPAGVVSLLEAARDTRLRRLLVPIAYADREAAERANPRLMLGDGPT